jgi:uncharacterized lipoprotein YajG
MKTLLVLPLAAAALLLAGCGKKEAAPSAEEKGDLAKMVGTVKTMTQSISQSVNQASARLEQALPEASKAVTETVNAVASGDVNAMLEQAKKLVGESKVKEASDIVQKLSNLQLTPEQKQLLEEIKALIQKATSADPAGAAAGALQNVLGGQK